MADQNPNPADWQSKYQSADQIHAATPEIPSSQNPNPVDWQSKYQSADTLGAPPPVQQPQNPSSPQPQNPSLLDSFTKGVIEGIPGSAGPGIGTAAQLGALKVLGKTPTSTTATGIPQEEVNKQFPNADTGKVGKGLEEVGKSASNPLTYMFGPGIAGSSALGSFTSGYTGSPWLGLLAGIGTGVGGNFIQQAANLSKSGFNAANKALGLEGASVAEARPDSTLWRRTYDWLMGTPGSTQITTNAAQARNASAENAVNNLADNLGAGANKAEAGSSLQTGAQDRYNSILAQHNNIATELENIRITNDVDVTPYFNSLQSVIGQLSPAGQAAAQPLQSQLVQKLLQGLNTALTQTGSRTLPYNDIKVIRTTLGDQLESAIWRGDGTTTAQLKTIYKGLSDTLRGAYTPGGQQIFDQLNSVMSQNYDQLERVVQPLLKEGISPEKLFNLSSNEAKYGASKLINIRNAVGEDAWNTFAGTTLRLMGKDNDGNFNLVTYANRWRQLDPTVQKALFSDTPYAELPAAYTQLALVASRFKQAGILYNRTESGNVVNVAQMFNDFIGGATETLVSTLAGSTGAAMLHNSEYGAIASAGIGAIGAVHGLSRATSSVNQYIVQNFLARIATNPTIVKWAGAAVPVKAFPMYANALVSYVNSHYPGSTLPAQILINFINQKYNLQPSNTEHHLEGGLVGWPEQTPTGYALGGYADSIQQYADGGVAHEAPLFTNMNQAINDMNLTPQEQNLYKYHLNNLYGKGKVVQPNGSISTVLQFPLEADGKYYNVPTVWNGKVVSPDEAIKNVQKLGIDKFPAYNSEDEAETRYQQMHTYMGKDVDNYTKTTHMALGGLTHIPSKSDSMQDYPKGYSTGGQVNTLIDHVLNGGSAFYSNPSNSPDGYAEGGEISADKFIKELNSGPQPLSMLPNGFSGNHTGSGTWAPSLLDAIVASSKNGYTYPAYHGNPRGTDIKKFREPTSNEDIGNNSPENYDAGMANFFSKNPEMANDFAMRGSKLEDFSSLSPDKTGWDPTGVVYPVILKMRNPKIVEDLPYNVDDYFHALKSAKENGHDGVIFKNTQDDYQGSGKISDDVYAVFSPNQIKSRFATEFDPSSSDISKAEGGLITPAKDSKPFYNPQLPGVSGGGPITSDKMAITGFADGGPVDQAVDFYKRELGLTDEQARGAVRWMNNIESNLSPDIENSIGAHGIAQWLGPRKAELFAQYGNKPTFQDQLNFSKQELLGKENKALQMLKNTKTEDEAYRIWGKYYERPSTKEYAAATGTSRTNSPTTTLLDHILPSPPSNDEVADNQQLQPDTGEMDWRIANDSRAEPFTKFLAGEILHDNH